MADGDLDVVDAFSVAPMATLADQARVLAGCQVPPAPVEPVGVRVPCPAPICTIVATEVRGSVPMGSSSAPASALTRLVLPRLASPSTHQGPPRVARARASCTDRRDISSRTGDHRICAAGDTHSTPGPAIPA